MITIKEALNSAHGANVFTKEFQKQYTILKKTCKKTQEAKDFIKSCKDQGYTTKKQTLNSLGLIFCTAIKAN